MYKDNCKNNAVKLKLFVNNDWNWVAIAFVPRDGKNINKQLGKGRKMSVPTLEKKNKKYFLRFAFEEEVKLNKTDIKDQKILAVDLGINTDATCSVMTADGTILARKFINFKDVKDQMYHKLDKIKENQQKFGSGNNIQKLWRQVKFRNDELTEKTAKAIIDLVVKHNCQVIVFEHLNFKGKKRGSRKQRLAIWRSNGIQHKVELKAHREGIRISTVSPWGTSSQAFDGSGKVQRGKYGNLPSYSLCKFSTGKIYNCDLNASYNIGARYYIREYLKIISKEKINQAVANDPDIKRRTLGTLNTLKNLLKVL
jgi:IS605 OrfB family transposase